MPPPGRGTSVQAPDADGPARAGRCGPPAEATARYLAEAVARHGRIATPRLVLRLAVAADAAALAAILRPEAVPMLASWPHPLSPAVASDKIERAIVRANRREVLAYVVRDRATGRVAGWCGAERWPVARDDIAMLTYWVGAGFEGRGYAAEAVRAAGAHMLAWIGTSRLGAATHAHNGRSLRTMRRAGLMTPDGVRQIWCSTRGRHETAVCFAASREQVAAWPGGANGSADEADPARVA